MNKIFLIAKREFLTKTGRKQFWVLTAVGPFLMLSLLLLPVLSVTGPGHKAQRTLYINDEEGSTTACLIPKLSPFYTIVSDYNQETTPDLMLNVRGSLSDPGKASLFINTNEHAGDEQLIGMALQTCFQQLPAPPPLITVKNPPATNSTADHLVIASMYAAILVYFFVFLYALQTMRSVIEDKTGRVAEILVTSVSPTQLMAGKIAGMGTVSLLQFVIWLGTIAAGSTWVYHRFQLSRFSSANLADTLHRVSDVKQAMEVHEIISALENLPLVGLVAVFLFCFSAGYWIYAALAAALGATGDSETDTQQYLLPLTSPLLAAFILLPGVLEHPHGTLALVLSYFPLTAPVVLPARLVFMPSAVEIALSCSGMLLGAVIITQLAGKVFKNVLLRYGKPVQSKEWLR